jgi:type II secretory pathway component GspD/PulD (secretin)
MRFLFLLVLCFISKFCVGQNLQLDKNKTMYVKFSNTYIDDVLNYFMNETKITIIKDPKIKTNLSIFSNAKVKHGDAFQLLFTSLKLAKIDVNIIEQFVVLKPIDTKPKTLLSDFKFPETPVLKSYQLKYASAMSLVNVLNNLFVASTNPFVIPDVFKASADNFSNSLIINTTNAKHEQVKEILAQLDVDRNPALKTNVFALKYALCSEVALTVQNVLSNLNRNGQFNVQIDSRTNSIVVLCGEDQVDDIRKIVGFLDQKVEMIDKTFLIMLQNAKPENITQILQQLFRR